MADGTDEDGAYATRMDEWVDGRWWKGPPLGARVNQGFPWFTPTFPCFHSFVRGARTPRLVHSALLRAEDSFCNSLPTESRRLVSFVLS
jgi:hypothetical protein